MRYLVDSDVLIDALNGQQEAVALFDRLRSSGIAISIISLGEIYDGALGSANPERHLSDARAFLSPYLLISLTDLVMLQFAQIRMDLRRAGELIPDFDILIAATAYTHDLSIVTRNLRHYQRIPGLTLYDMTPDQK